MVLTIEDFLWITTSLAWKWWATLTLMVKDPRLSMRTLRFVIITHTLTRWGRALVRKEIIRLRGYNTEKSNDNVRWRGKSDVVPALWSVSLHNKDFRPPILVTMLNLLSVLRLRIME